MNALQKILTASALVGAGLVAACAAAPALAQTSYPTAASGVRVPGTVPLQCDASGAACAPVGPANPATAGAIVQTSPAIGGGDGSGRALQVDGRGYLWVNPGVGGNTAMLTTAQADATGNNPTRMSAQVFGMAFNGTTWDRQRGDTNGLAVQPALSANFWSYAAPGTITNTVDVAIKAAGGAGVRNYISSIQFKNTAATASEIVIKDGATVLWRGHASASMTFMELVKFDPPLKGTANTVVNAAMITTGTATYVNAQGYTGF